MYIQKCWLGCIKYTSWLLRRERALTFPSFISRLWPDNAISSSSSFLSDALLFMQSRQISFASISLWTEDLNLIRVITETAGVIWLVFEENSFRSDIQLFFRNWPVFLFLNVFKLKDLNRLFQSVQLSSFLMLFKLSYFQSVKTCARWLLGPFCNWVIVGGHVLLKVRLSLPIPW